MAKLSLLQFLGIVLTKHLSTNSVEESLQIQVDQLARDLALKINETRGGERERLYERAIDVLREQVEDRAESGDEVLEKPSVEQVEQTSNPFAIGIPLALLGYAVAYSAVVKYQRDIKARLREKKARRNKGKRKPPKIRTARYRRNR